MAKAKTLSIRLTPEAYDNLKRRAEDSPIADESLSDYCRRVLFEPGPGTLAMLEKRLTELEGVHADLLAEVGAVRAVKQGWQCRKCKCLCTSWQTVCAGCGATLRMISGAEPRADDAAMRVSENAQNAGLAPVPNVWMWCSVCKRNRVLRSEYVHPVCGCGRSLVSMDDEAQVTNWHKCECCRKPIDDIALAPGTIEQPFCGNICEYAHRNQNCACFYPPRQISEEEAEALADRPKCCCGAQLGVGHNSDTDFCSDECDVAHLRQNCACFNVATKPEVKTPLAGRVACDCCGDPVLITGSGPPTSAFCSHRCEFRHARNQCGCDRVDSTQEPSKRYKDRR